MFGRSDHNSPESHCESPLVDIDLPDISGFEVVARARATGGLRDTRVVFCTGGCPEERLPLGPTMEQAGDYPSAIRFYREAFAMELARNDVWYFINNILGYRREPEHVILDA
jgi:CheY-like chemotaxis protein